MESLSDNKINSYTLTKKKGIDDLQSEFAFRGNSQGDESVSNSVEEYKAAKGWMSCVFQGINPEDQEAINKEVERRKAANLQYIEELKAKGEFGKDYEYTIHIKPNPIFDHPKVNPPLENYRMIFIDGDEIKE